MLKPSKRYFAKAIPVDGGYAGQFALPGLEPDRVRKLDGSVEIFGDEGDAYNAACRTLVKVLESRVTDSRKAGGYERITPVEFSAALAAADITATYFAELYGVPFHRVMKWLDGEQDVPHGAHLLVRLLVHEAVFEEVKAITEKALETDT